MKSMLDKSVRDEFIARVNNVTTESQGQWGKMRPDQALNHINNAIDMSLGRIKAEGKPSFMMKLLKPMILRAPIQRGKFETFKEIKSLGDYDINTEKQRFAKLMQEYEQKPNMQPQPASPLLGKMNAKEWGMLDYSHTNHHLTQFGV